MEEAAKTFFDSLQNFSDVNKLLDDGEAEDTYLECKTHRGVKLDQGIRTQLARAISGFSNSDGGVVIYGISTVTNQAGLDVLTQIIPIANVKHFQKELINKFSKLSTPSGNFETKIIKKRKTDTSGLVILFIPKSIGDPIQSLQDNQFYFRSGDEFIIAPYEIIKRLFAASESPDLTVTINDIKIKYENGSFTLPVIVSNSSSAIGEHCVVQVRQVNEAALELASQEGFRDVSDINITKTFSTSLQDVVHKSLGIQVGILRVKLKNNKRKLTLRFNVYANKMRARMCIISLMLLKNRSRTISLKQLFI